MKLLGQTNRKRWLKFQRRNRRRIAKECVARNLKLVMDGEISFKDSHARAMVEFAAEYSAFLSIHHLIRKWSLAN